MSTYLHQSNRINIYPTDSLNTKTRLSPGVYTIDYSMEQGFFLTQSEPFHLPEKVYGDIPSISERVLRTFNDRVGRNTGVMLLGEKGSGKSLLSKYICTQSNLPVLVVTGCYSGPSFKSFLDAIDEPCVVFFDEYEKIYNDRKDQWNLLSMFDGTSASQKLFLFTCNDELSIDVHMMNRPGRVYYLINFDSMSEQAILEYCDNTLKYPEYRGEILNFTYNFSKFNFDMLSAVVEEVNRYNQSPSKFADLINVKAKYNYSYSTYNCVLHVAERSFNIGKFSLNTSDMDGDNISFGVVFQTKLWEEYVANNTVPESLLYFGRNLVRNFRHDSIIFNEDTVEDITFMVKNGFMAFLTSREMNVAKANADIAPKGRSHLALLQNEAYESDNDSKPEVTQAFGQVYIHFNENTQMVYDYTNSCVRIEPCPGVLVTAQYSGTGGR